MSAQGLLSTRRRPTADEWRAIQELFDIIVELPPARRQAALAARKADPFILSEVGDLLAAVDEAGVLDLRQDAPDDTSYLPELQSLPPGAEIGAFKIERLIGRGGAGEVYLAHRHGADFEQRVALKLLQPEAAGDSALFDAERQLLSQLEHPSIARLIDGGTAPDGRTYMAMEYVDGTDIVSWCRNAKAGLAARLALFAQVCSAVAYAHKRLIVHRDLKPSNMLVDADGRVRLLDFGIASLIGGAGDAAGAAVLTPEYAAPEQFENRTPTTAVDVYGLGATLFELLTGRALWQFTTTPLPAVLRRLLQGEPPLASIAAAAVTDGPVAPRLLKGDLDAIIAKALHADPAQRYDSVDGLAADLARHQAHLPVVARTGSRAYRTRRFVRRHPWGVAATAAACLAIVVGTAGIALQMRATAVERDIAIAEASRAEAINQSLSLMFRSAGESGTARTATAKDMLDASAAKLIAGIDPDDPKQASVVLALGELYAFIDDVTAVETLIQQALDKGVGRTDTVMTANLKLQLGSAKAARSEFVDARRLLAEADVVWQTDPAQFRVQRLEANASEAYMRRLEGDREGGIKLLMESQAEAELAYAPGSRELLTRYNNLAVHLVEANRLDETEAVLDRADRAVVEGNAQHTSSALVLLGLRGALASRRGDMAGAERYLRQGVELRRELYAPSAALASDMLNFSRVLMANDKATEALGVLNEAGPIADQYLGPDSLVAVVIRLAHIDALCALHRAFAADIALMAIEGPAASGGVTTLQYGLFLRGRGFVRLEQGRLDDSSAALDQAEAVFKALGPAGQAFLTDIATLRTRIAAAKAG